MGKNLPTRLDDLGPRIRQLMRQSGTPGLSVAVAARGQPVYHANYGVRDVETCERVTEDTVFPVASLAKTVSAAALGILVDRGTMSWDSPIKDIIPSFQSRDEFLQENTTLELVLSHATGMSSCGNLVGGSEANVLIGREERMTVVNDQVLLPDRFGLFSYNSTAWDICDEIIEHTSGQSTHEFIKKSIFTPLGMERSFMITPPRDLDDVAKCYNALDDGTPYPVPNPKLGDNGIGSASGGLRSCASDLVKLYKAFGHSYRQRGNAGGATVPPSPLQETPTLMSAKVPLGANADHGVSYGLGWVRVQLPNTLGHIGLNGRLMPGELPILGEGVPGQTLFYHQGTLPGALAVAMLLPDTESVIVVLSNSMALSDVPDWVSQMVLEQLLEVPSHHQIDFIKYAANAIRINLNWYSVISQALSDGLPTIVRLPTDWAEFTGNYVDASGVFKVVVSLVNGQLYWSFQGLPSEMFSLVHYEGDVFTWLQPRNQMSRRGRWILGNDRDAAFWKVRFKRNARGCVETLLWVHDPTLKPLMYAKRPVAE